MKKHILILAGCVVFVSLILGGLYVSSTLSKKEIYRASFDRTFAEEPVVVKQEMMDLKKNSFYISGITADKIYIGNQNAPFTLIETNTLLGDSQRIQVKPIGLDTLVEPRMFRTTIDSPNFFLSNGVMGIILRGDMRTWEAKQFMPDKGYYFAEAVPLGSSTHALRSYSQARQAFQLAKKTAVDTPSFKFKYGLLEKQSEGLYSVSGQLLYNKDMKRLVYLYTYRNQYIVMDTNLNLAYRANTIDTFSVAQIKLTTVESKSKNASMASSPPFVVNGLSCVSGKYLFVNSYLLAHNENERSFKNSAVIDVYDLDKAAYVNSFYVPNYKNNRLSDFRVSDQKLVALQDHYLVVYQLDTTIFSKSNTAAPGKKSISGITK